MSFGWDICPRILTVGVWRPVELEVFSGARFRDIRIGKLESDSGIALARIDSVIEWCGMTDATARISGSIGEVSIDGTLQDRREITTGLRAVQLIQKRQPSGARSFGFRVNGHDIFVTGLNWTPLDPLFPRITPEKTTETLTAVSEIGGNMLRVWGGGIYEDDHFYRECGRLGIMVWQDFMLACGWYPQTDHLADELDREARQIIVDLKYHPSLIVIRRYFPPGTEWPVTNAMWYTQDPEFGGFLIWNVRDCWPKMSDSVIDCDGNEKLIFRRLAGIFARCRSGRQPGFVLTQTDSWPNRSV